MICVKQETRKNTSRAKPSKTKKKEDKGDDDEAADDGEELNGPTTEDDDGDDSSGFTSVDQTLDSWKTTDADNKTHETRSAKKKQPAAKKVLNSSNDIVCLVYYDRDEKEIESLEELQKNIDDNKCDQTKGVPEELVWVKYKNSKTDREYQLELWTEIVIVGQRSMLKTWMGKRGQLKKKRARGFPQAVEDYAASVIEKLSKKDSRKHIALCRHMQSQWENNGLVPGSAD